MIIDFLLSTEAGNLVLFVAAFFAALAWIYGEGARDE